MLYTVPPSPPTDITIQSVDIGSTYVRVCWQAPLFLGIPEVTRYEVTATPLGGGTPVTARTTDNSRDVNMTGLLPGTNYEFRVLFYSISWEQDLSGSQTISTPAPRPKDNTLKAPLFHGLGMKSSSHRCVGQQILASIHPCESLETQG